jgi:prolipoprotein diacylglyceryltransferase
MTIGYYYAIPRYTKLTDPGEKEVKEIYFYGEITVAILTSRLFYISVNRESYYKKFP